MSPQGDKSAYTSKQRRQAHHIEDSVKRRGGSSGKAARIAYATVNKQDKGGKKSGSGRGRSRSTVSSKRGGKATATRAGRPTRTRSSARKTSRKSPAKTTRSRKTATSKAPVRKTVARKVGGVKGAARANRTKRTTATQRRGGFHLPHFGGGKGNGKKEHLNPIQKIVSVFR